MRRRMGKRAIRRRIRHRNRADCAVARKKKERKTRLPGASYCIWSTEPVGYTSAVSSRLKESLLQLL